tara:strand:- start:20734 stop:21366 length:633 start_codon:yes stop_codon:yes gene_type:complete
MSDLVFYTNPMSRGRIIRWMLEEIGCEYQTQLIEHGPAMKAASFLSINPMGKVPALSHRGRVVTETPAILAYLADAFPDANLAPAPEQRQAYYRWLFFAAGPLEAALSNKHMGFEIPDDPRMRGTSGYGSYELVVEVLAKAVADVNYIAGEQFSAADIYLGSHIRWGVDVGTLPKLPEFERYIARVSDRDAFHRAMEIDNALMPPVNDDT